MFKEFLFFELKHWIKSPLVYIFFLVNFLMVFSASIFEHVTVGSDMGNVNINSPFAMMSYAALVSLISVVMTTTFVNQAALKDFNHNFHSILFSAPIKRTSYLLGRFVSSVLAACIPLLGILLAVFVAPFFYEDLSMVGPNYVMAYVDTFFTFLLPNTILISAIIFALSVKFRSTSISFVGAVFLLVGYLFACNFLTTHEYAHLAIWLDPFGVNAISEITKYWTLNEKNSQWLSFAGPMLANRLLWLGIAAMIFTASYYNFSFAVRSNKARKKETQKSEIPNQHFKVLSKLPIVSTVYNKTSYLLQLLSQFKSDFFGIVKSPAFMIITFFSVINLMAGINASSIRSFPVTYLMLESIEGSLHLFIYVIILYYTGTMVWRERHNKFNEIIDAAPFPSWIPIASKYLSMLSAVIFILLIAMFTGMGMQAVQGYYIFEPIQYFKQLFLIDLGHFALLIAVSLFIHVLANNMYFGFFLFILFLVLNQFVWSALEIESNLMIIGGIPSFTYSDMHQYALGAAGLKWYNLYWLLFASILVISSVLFWARGNTLNLGKRLAAAKQRFNGKLSVSFYSVLSIWMLVGGYLFYNANILNEHVSELEENRIDMSYENLYKQYENIDQPRIVALDHTIDIHPYARKMQAFTAVVLKNKHDHPIDSIHFTTSSDYRTKIDLPNSDLVYRDDERHYYIYRLDNALYPGDSLQFYVHSDYEAQGIENEISVKWINENGTFIHSRAFMPIIGYDRNREHHNPSAREQFGLPPSGRAPELQHACSFACRNSCISSDADWISLRATVSTAADQIAIAPGTLVKEWKKNNRNYYRYELDKPVVNFYSFLSARYKVKREKWKDVDLEVYYHEGHEYNVDRIMRALRSSLSYFSENFSPYPHKQARIIEFPRYASFAQAFPGTMPYAESMGYIAKYNDVDDVDKVFHTVAHEMAHQWWGHQVLGAEMQGVTMLSETFAQYSALMALEKEYGKRISRKFLKYEMDAYLRSRGGERIAELPLLKVENQDYIHYAKGSVVMNALKEYLGADSLNMVMRRFIAKNAYQEPPYTNTHDFVEELERMTPDSLQYLVDDMIKDIVLYNNKAVKGEYRPLNNGQYELILTVEIDKYRADKKGKEETLVLDDYIYIGVYGDIQDGDVKEKELYYKLHKFNKRDNTLKLILDEAPSRAGIDPYHLLIDRIGDDNIVDLKLTIPSPN